MTTTTRAHPTGIDYLPGIPGRLAVSATEAIRPLTEAAWRVTSVVISTTSTAITVGVIPPAGTCHGSTLSGPGQTDSATGPYPATSAAPAASTRSTAT